MWRRYSVTPPAHQLWAVTARHTHKQPHQCKHTGQWKFSHVTPGWGQTGSHFISHSLTHSESQSVSGCCGARQQPLCNLSKYWLFGLWGKFWYLCAGFSQLAFIFYWSYSLPRKSRNESDTSDAQSVVKGTKMEYIFSYFICYETVVKHFKPDHKEA